METMFKAHAADATGAGSDGDDATLEPADATPEVAAAASTGPLATGCPFSSVMRAVSMRPRTTGDATTHLKDISCVNFKPSAPKPGKIKSPVVTMWPWAADEDCAETFEVNSTDSAHCDGGRDTLLPRIMISYVATSSGYTETLPLAELIHPFRMNFRAAAAAGDDEDGDDGDELTVTWAK